MSLLVAVLALAAGLLLGLSLGALGGGGSILAVPVLVYAFGQSAGQATTGSLVVVGLTSSVAALTARRAGNVLLGRGLAFGAVAVGGAGAGAVASRAVPQPVLLAAFAGLLLLVATVMLVRQVRHRDDPNGHHHGDHHGEPGPVTARVRRRAALDDPIITFSPTFACSCPRAVKVLVTATVVGLLTGFFGVGGGFLVVPALVLALGLPMEFAAGTSLVVITVTSGAALAVRAGAGVSPDWTLVGLLAGGAVVGGVIGARAADRVDTDRLQVAFTALVVGVAGYTAWQAVPALV